MSTLFTSNLSNSVNCGTELWIDLGLIPSGHDYWVGNAQYTSPSKSITCELRTNNLTKSTGTVTNTTIIDTCAASPKTGTLTRDLYKSGRLHIKTVVSTGVEHWWLRLVSKTSGSGDLLYNINYITE